MRYFKFYVETPYCGTDETELCTYPDEITTEELNSDCDDWARSHCEDYEYLATGWDDEWEDDEEREAVVEQYWNDCGWGWEELDEEEFLAEKELE